jgi:hypothetical protein
MFRFGLVFVVLACGGCTSFRNPIVAEGGPTLDPALIGHWVAENGDGERMEFEIRAAGGIGLVILESSSAEEGFESEQSNLVTARVGQRDYASLQPREDNEDGRWLLFGYELAAPDRLLVHHADDEFWKRAVRDRIVTGTVRNGTFGAQAEVTASVAEMRSVVLGYGAVLFKDEAGFELRREPPAD